MQDSVWWNVIAKMVGGWGRAGRVEAKWDDQADVIIRSFLSLAICVAAEGHVVNNGMLERECLQLIIVHSLIYGYKASRGTVVIIWISGF